MMVRSVPVGVLYAINRKDKGFTTYDIMLLELIATQAAPVIENALLWERLREAAASEERLRIARDLHDNFLQTLAAIKLHLERCKILIEKDSDKAKDCIERIHDISTRALAEVRSYLTELRIVGPDPAKFNQTISRCVSESATKGGFKTQLDISLPDEGIRPEVALAAFHIIKELLNNAATHSKATIVNIKLYIANEKLYIEVKDNGIGFEVMRVRAEKASQGHLGLVGVDERARQTKGSVTITSSPGNGTHTIVKLSLA